MAWIAAALRAYLSSLVVNMTSALVRLAVIGQTDAQRVIAELMPRIGETASEKIYLSWEDSVRLDLYYVENWSLTSDILILLRTIKTVLKPEGAY